MFLPKKTTELVFFGLCFVSLFIFFSYAHPLVPYDGDDWFFLAAIRDAYPYWGGWNPVKVLPETLMPLCGYISAYFFRPIVGDYVTAITVCASLFISITITIYFYSFYRLLDIKFGLPLKGSLSIIVLLVLFHFMIFESNQFNNTYMFYSTNLTCYFHYGLPALVNSILVMYLLRFENFLMVDITKNGMILLSFYLAIFSNIYHSVILAVCIFVRLASAFFSNSDEHSINSIKEFAKMNYRWFFVIAIWIVSLIFEANGGRADQIGHSILSLPIKQSLFYLECLLRQTSAGFCIVLFLTSWLSRIIYLKRKNKDYVDYMFRDLVKHSLLCFVLVLVYVILVSAKAFPNHIANADVAISFLFYLFMLLCFSFAYIIQRYPKILCLFPCICFIITVHAFNSDRHFKNSNIRNISPYKCVLVDKDLIKQIVTADKEGKTKMTLVVPKGDNKDNWPHPVYMGPNISRTLYTHGIISHDIKITIEFDSKINLKYHLGY